VRTNSDIPSGDTPPPDSPAFISTQVSRARLFFLDLKPSPATQALTVTCGGFEAVRPDYRIDRTDFPWFSLEFVMEGTGALELRGTAIPLRAGSFFLYGPGVGHRITSDPAKPLGKYFVDFAGAEAHALLSDLDLEPGSHGECQRPALLRDDFEALIEAGNRRSAHASAYCRARTTELLINCADFRLKSGTLGSRAFQTYERCRQRIAEAHASLQSLDDMARLCHVDKAYLCRLFARYDVQTPHAWLQRVRIDHAAKHLLSSDDPVKRVAELFGFADPFHFSKVFTRLKGISPGRYARQKRTG